MSKGLSEVASTTLQRLRDGLQSGQLRAPLVRSDLVAFGETAQLDALIGILGGHPRAACIALLDAVLAERAKLVRPAPELVWTGPEAPHSSARDTAVVLRDLFDRARLRVVLAGYSFSHSLDVLGPLFAGMRDRGVHATFFVEVAQPLRAVSDPEAYGQAAMSAFVEENWPFGSPLPNIYCDARALQPGPRGRACTQNASPLMERGLSSPAPTSLSAARGAISKQGFCCTSPPSPRSWSANGLAS